MDPTGEALLEDLANAEDMNRSSEEVDEDEEDSLLDRARGTPKVRRYL